MTLGDQPSERARLAFVAANWLSQRRKPSEALGLIIEPRHDGQTVGIKCHGSRE
ncbi:MAG TPA: hypothetical protein VEV61_16670 [Streptosporangiaceae bacterium]|nr:hypothetical protein [Streptosporangiaceae bacterium]